MNIELVDEISNLLKRDWKMVFYTDYALSYSPDLAFNLKHDYDILARQILLYCCEKNYNQRQFIETISSFLYTQAKWYAGYWHREYRDQPVYFYVSKFLCRKVARLIYSLTIKNDLSAISSPKIRIELAQKYRSHCCSELECTDNAEKRYFFRSRVVYIREANTYVLTNLRKYEYDSKNDLYYLNNKIHYMILDYCPFCGANLKKVRIENKLNQKLIENAISKWRDGAVGLLDEGEEEFHKMTYYGINCYDSYWFISGILSQKYAVHEKWGADVGGNISNKGRFITVDKLLNLASKNDLYLMVCEYTNELGISDSSFDSLRKYFEDKFDKHIAFSKKEIDVLRSVLFDIMWSMWHQPEYFDELLEGETK